MQKSSLPPHSSSAKMISAWITFVPFARVVSHSREGVLVGEADRKSRRIIIACRVMEPELAHIVSEKNGADDRMDILYLEQALNRTPDKLLMKVQEKIDQVARSAVRIVLGY